MRILILGTTKGTVTKLCQQCFGHFGGEGCVVTTPELVGKLWKEEEAKVSVQSTLTFQSSLARKSKCLVVDRVTSAEFFARADVQAAVRACENVVVSAEVPLDVLSMDTVKLFDKVLISKTNGEAKLMQYFTLFVNPADFTFKDFKQEVASLKKLGYLEVDTKEHKMTNKFVDSAVPAGKLHSDVAVTSITEGLGNMFVEERPQAAPPLGDNMLEAKVVLQKARHDGSALESFRSMIGADILKNMYTVALVDEKCKKDHLVFYFQVRRERSDLFTAMVVNILRALKESKTITFGTFLV
jgi:hypothetical protein